MIVAKPVQDYSDWLTGENTRTHEVGEFPGTYVEYIGDIRDLPQAQDEIGTPPIPPPRPPRIAKPDSGHSLVETSTATPVWCYQCEDFIWGFESKVSRCSICDLSWHPQCAVELSKFPCKIHPIQDEEDEDDDTYIHFVSDPGEWQVEDVLLWLAATNHYFMYAEVFREHDITGTKLREMTDTTLCQMSIVDPTHKQSLLLAVQELFTGQSEIRKPGVFNSLQSAKSGTKGSHLFNEETFHTLQWCDKCGKALWGLYRQGVQCSECGFQCHRKCMFDSIVVCPRRRVRKRRESDAEVPVFGTELGFQFRPAERPAPTVVMKCVQALERGGLKEMGIHSIIPPGSEKHSLRTALNQSAKNVNMEDEEWRNPHCVSAVLKMYLNELPACVFTEEKYLSFINMFKAGSRQSVGAKITEMVKDLPDENKSLLMYLLEHLYRVSQNVDWNDMSTRKLAALFAPLLLRPGHQQIMSLVENHEITVNIIDLLLTTGEWTREKKPPVPPRKQHSAAEPAAQEWVERLQDCPWYWGEINKETVNERLKDQPDGTYIVRDSRRFAGEYTLTLRKGGVNKLIRILYKDGLYGFSEPLTFPSVVELINCYKHRSLASYNPKLDVKLEIPLHKYEQDDDDIGSNLQTGDDKIIYLEKLRRVHQEFVEKSDDYEIIYDEFVKSEQEITDYHEELDAHREIVQMIDDQITLHETFQKEAPPQNRAILRQNFELLKHKKQEANGMLMTLEREISNTLEKTRTLNKRMNSIKPEIIKLQRSKQKYYLVLTTEKGMDLEKIKEEIGEEGSEGPASVGHPDNIAEEEEGIYDQPEVDLSESRWLRGKLSKDEAKELLEDKVNGTFVIRESASRAGEYALALKHRDCVKHIAINRGPRGGYGFAVNYTNHKTLYDLVCCYHATSLQVHNNELDTTLMYPLGDDN